METTRRYLCVLCNESLSFSGVVGGHYAFKRHTATSTNQHVSLYFIPTAVDLGVDGLEGCLNDTLCYFSVAAVGLRVVLDLHPDPQPGQPQHADGEERVPRPAAGAGGRAGQEEALPAVPARRHPGQGLHGPLGPACARRGGRLAHQLQQVGETRGFEKGAGCFERRDSPNGIRVGGGRPWLTG